MKKTPKNQTRKTKRLELDTEVVRTIDTADLAHVVGGALPSNIVGL
jgi:hypothetical protein